MSKATHRIQKRAAIVKGKRIRFFKDMDDMCVEHSEPSKAIYGMIAKHLDCKICDIFRQDEFIPTVRLGTYLSGVKEMLADFTLDGVRNFTRDGTESPNQYRIIPLTSKREEDFLVEGMAFYRRGNDKTICRFEPTWNGIEMTCYTTRKNMELNRKIVQGAWQWASENNFLKGEAFSLSGEFLKTTKETWDDVILDDKIKKVVRQSVDQFNAKGKSFPNRGLIFLGNPGNGKTLSGRCIRNTAKGSFIWISARDFHNFGAVNGLSFAFELAKEVAPAVLFMEDVDAWLSDTAVDLIKTEMDGISRSTGVLTVLTTNFPERLPDALIDRPGRFHDVLKFDFPTPQARREMLSKWLNGYPPAAVAQAVQAMQGYSGAHVFELAQFAKTLQESDDLTPEEAVKQALAKIAEQRELIDQIQLEGANYNRRRKFSVEHRMKKMWRRYQARS